MKEPPEPKFFKPSPYLDDRINRNIADSELEGGQDLTTVTAGQQFEIQTQTRKYRLEVREKPGGKIGFWLSGHPEHCPEPVEVNIYGSTWGGSILRDKFLGRRMRMQYYHPDRDKTITTSEILSITEIPKTTGEKT